MSCGLSLHRWSMLHFLNSLQWSVPKDRRISPSSRLLPGGGRQLRMKTTQTLKTAPILIHLVQILADAGAALCICTLQCRAGQWNEFGSLHVPLAVQAKGGIMAVAGHPGGACAWRNDACCCNSPRRRHRLAVKAGTWIESLIGLIWTYCEAQSLC